MNIFYIPNNFYTTKLFRNRDRDKDKDKDKDNKEECIEIKPYISKQLCLFISNLQNELKHKYPHRGAKVLNNEELLDLFKKDIDSVFKICHLVYNYQNVSIISPYITEPLIDNNTYYLPLITSKFKFPCKRDLFIFDSVTPNYIHTLELIMQIIRYYQQHQGSSIIKINSIVYKPVLKIIYTLTMMYKSVYIVKPLNGEYPNENKFLVCLNYQHPINYIHELPLNFINKMEEINSILGKQLLEKLLFSLSKSRN